VNKFDVYMQLLDVKVPRGEHSGWARAIWLARFDELPGKKLSSCRRALGRSRKALVLRTVGIGQPHSISNRESNDLATWLLGAYKAVI